MSYGLLGVDRPDLPGHAAVRVPQHEVFDFPLAEALIEGVKAERRCSGLRVKVSGRCDRRGSPAQRSG